MPDPVTPPKKTAAPAPLSARLARQRRRRIDIGAAAIGQQKGAIGAAIPGDAVGIGEREERADRQIFRLPSPLLPGIVRPPPRHRARILRATRTIAAQFIEAMREVDIVAAKAAFGEEKRNVGGKWSIVASVDHHAGEPRRQRQPPQPSALLGDTAIAVDRTKLAEQCLGLSERRTRR